MKNLQCLNSLIILLFVFSFISTENNILLKGLNKHTNCKDIRFHDLRHTFATVSLENGMDIKTLSAIIGHVSSATTIDIYSHVTDTMQVSAAEKIENGMGSGLAYRSRTRTEKRESTMSTAKPKKNAPKNLMK